MLTNSDVEKLDKLFQKRLHLYFEQKIQPALNQQNVELKTYIEKRLDLQFQEKIQPALDNQKQDLKDYITDSFSDFLDKIDDLFKEHQSGKLYPHRFQIST